MAVLIQVKVPGITRERYEGMQEHVSGPLKAAKGFHTHVGVIDADGLTVTEVWDSEADWQAFFDSTIRGNIPDDSHQPEISEITRFYQV